MEFPKKEIELDTVAKTKSRAREEQFQAFRDSVTLHGFRYLFEGSSIRRFSWFVIWLSAFTMSGALSYSLIKDYNTNKVVTSNYYYPDPEPLNFPTVTVCPIHSRSTSKLLKLQKELNISIDDYLYFYRHLTHYPMPNMFSDAKTVQIMKKLKENNISTHSEILFNHHFCSNHSQQNSKIQNLLSGQLSCSFFKKPCPMESLKCVSVLPESVCLQFNFYDSNKPSLKNQNHFLLDGLQMHFDLSDTFYWEKDYPTKKNIVGALVYFAEYGKVSSIDMLRYYVLKPGGYHILKVQKKKVKV